MFEYEKGYFKALQDLSNYIDSHSESIKWLKQRKYNFIVNLIKHLLSNVESKELFKRYGGDVMVECSNDKGSEILKCNKQLW